MRLALILVLASITAIPIARAQSAAADSQIRSAVLPLPEDYRGDATIMGYDSAGALVVLREGSNAMICLADDPSDDRFHVACYHESLEPFMARGRELRANGLGRDSVEVVRRKEIMTGELRMPDSPAALYSLTGGEGSWSAETGAVENVRSLHVIYTPFATLEETGLPASAPPGRPWLMDPGQPWAHVMIVGPATDP